MENLAIGKYMKQDIIVLHMNSSFVTGRGHIIQC